MNTELRRAAEAIKERGADEAWHEAHMLADHYLSAPDELAEAREIIDGLLELSYPNNKTREFLVKMRERAVAFRKRTETQE